MDKYQNRATCAGLPIKRVDNSVLDLDILDRAGGERVDGGSLCHLGGRDVRQFKGTSDLWRTPRGGKLGCMGRVDNVESGRRSR
jgi:hypothetical protein